MLTKRGVIMSYDKQPYRGDPAASQGALGGVQYLGPERAEHYHDHDAPPPAPLSRRVVLAATVIALTALGILNVARAVISIVALGALAVNPDPTSNVAPSAVGLIGSLILAGLFLAYPIVVLVRRLHRRA
jgi:hypothetical protein